MIRVRDGKETYYFNPRHIVHVEKTEMNNNVFRVQIVVAFAAKTVSLYDDAARSFLTQLNRYVADDVEGTAP